MKLVAVCGAETTPVLCVFAGFAIFFPILSGVFFLPRALLSSPNMPL